MIPLRDSTKSESFPVITILLILLNLSIYLFESQLDQQALSALVTAWGLTPAHLTAALPLHFLSILPTFFSAMFLHSSWAHVIGNMWMLWLFGDNVEDKMGKLRYVAFYFVCGILASLMHCLIFPSSAIPVIGASGAVSGIMGAYFLLFRRASILTWIFPVFFVPIPAFVYLGLWGVSQFFSGTTGLFHTASVGGSVAFWAHIGGFAAGMFLHRFFLKTGHLPEAEHRLL